MSSIESSDVPDVSEQIVLGHCINGKDFRCGISRIRCDIVLLA